MHLRQLQVPDATAKLTAYGAESAGHWWTCPEYRGPLTRINEDRWTVMDGIYLLPRCRNRDQGGPQNP